jgi:hypothetical protein
MNGTKQRTRRRSRQVEACYASSVLFFFLAPAHIYKKELLGFLATQKSSRVLKIPRVKFEVAK